MYDALKWRSNYKCICTDLRFYKSVEKDFHIFHFSSYGQCCLIIIKFESILFMLLNPNLYQDMTIQQGFHYIVSIKFKAVKMGLKR